MASVFKLALTSLAAVALTSTIAVAKPGLGHGQHYGAQDQCPYFESVLAQTGSIDPRAALRLDRKVLDFLLKQPAYSKDVQSVYDLEDILYGEMRVLRAFENAAEPSANDIRKQAANVIKIKKQIISIRQAILEKLLQDQALLDQLYPRTKVLPTQTVVPTANPVQPQLNTEQPVQQAVPQAEVTNQPVYVAPQVQQPQQVDNRVDIDAPVPAVSQEPVQKALQTQPQEFPN